MSTKKYKILMVEDDADQIMMYQTQFEIDGFKFLTGKRYDDIKKIIDKENPDIILLDLLLGAESGENILLKLKKEKLTDRIPVFIFTNLKNDRDDEKFIKLGACGYWPKTKFVPSQLCDTIKKFLDKKHNC
jgi:DNA-binding response OmpR family regulator